MTSNEKMMRLGYWLSQKKSKKLSIPEIESALRLRNIEPVKIEIERSLDEQGPFNVILHKLTDFIAKAEEGDVEAESLIKRIEEYGVQNPTMLMIDSLDCLRTLMNRFKTYTKINNSLQGAAFVPKFVVIYSKDLSENVKILEDGAVTFPAVAKRIIAHGPSAHQEVTLPCVVQSFVNHNAVLFKLFAFGKKYFMIERPSIRDFYNFERNEVSKANSNSALTVQESFDSKDCSKVSQPRLQPSPEVLQFIVSEIGKCLGLKLFGVDVVIDSATGRHAVIDVNAFPGYDGVDGFPEELADFIRDALKRQLKLNNDG